MKDTLYKDFSEILDLKISKFQNILENKVHDQKSSVRETIRKFEQQI